MNIFAIFFFILFSPLWENILKNQLKINFLYRFGCNVARHQDGKWALADTVTTAEWVPQLQSRVFHPTARPNTIFLSDARWVALAVTRHPSLLLSVAPCSLIMLFFFFPNMCIYVHFWSSADLDLVMQCNPHLYLYVFIEQDWKHLLSLLGNTSHFLLFTFLSKTSSDACFSSEKK